MKISENLLHFIWRNRLFADSDLVFENEQLAILQVGQHNTDAGPDFFNARIKLGETIWAGNVEIHLKSSDWLKHGHHKNEAYDNVILQVVLKDDMPIHRTNGEGIPTAELKIPEHVLASYKTLMLSDKTIACSDNFAQLDSFALRSWLNVLWMERIERKTENIRKILAYTTQNWEETFYISLARSFGAKINAEPFELLAKSLSSIILAKHKSSIFQIEALLFGQAGFLEEGDNSDYFRTLKKEYNFLRRKYDLKNIDTHLWKFMRLRPPAFPTIRISQFAHLVHKSSHLFSKILDSESVGEVMQSFESSTSNFWKTHYRFGKESPEKVKSLGKTAIRGIIINTVIPILFLYGKERNLPEFIDRALQFAETLPPEKNAATRAWEDLNVKNKDAFSSQALIQLYSRYCKPRRCVDCRIGGKLLSKSENA